MKTRLLKRLRREAKMLYKIKRIGGEYYVYARKNKCIFIYLYYWHSSPYKCLKDAQYKCNLYRQAYILREVSRLKRLIVMHGKFINF